MNNRIAKVVDEVIKEEIQNYVDKATEKIQAFVADEKLFHSNTVPLCDWIEEDLWETIGKQTAEIDFSSYKMDGEPENSSGGIMPKVARSELGGYGISVEVFNSRETVDMFGIRFNEATNKVLNEHLSAMDREYLKEHQTLESISGIEMIEDKSKLNFTINGQENKFYNVGYVNGEFGINYDDSYNNDGYTHTRSAITVDKKDLEVLGLTPQNFVELLNNPNSNVTINASYGGLDLGLQDLKQYVCVEVVENGRLCARGENLEIMNFIREDIQDQMQCDVLQAYREDLSKDNTAVFITDNKNPMIDKTDFIDETEPNIIINYNQELKQLTIELEGHTEDEHSNGLVEFLQDKFGNDREEQPEEDKIVIISPVGMEFSETDIAKIADKLQEIEQNGYEYDGLIGTQFINGYGYKEGQMTVGEVNDNYDYGCYVNVEEIVFTESDVRKLGYEPKEFVELINQPEGTAITFKADYGHGVIDENFNDEETYQLNTYDMVRVMSDDWSTCVASRSNDERMMNAFQQVYDMREREIDRQEQNTDDLML